MVFNIWQFNLQSDIRAKVLATYSNAGYAKEIKID